MINENGIARATIKVVEILRKKRYKTNTAKKAPHKPDPKSSTFGRVVHKVEFDALHIGAGFNIVDRC